MHKEREGGKGRGQQGQSWCESTPRSNPELSPAREHLVSKGVYTRFFFQFCMIYSALKHRSLKSASSVRQERSGFLFLSTWLQ